MVFKIFLIIFCLFLPFAAQGASLDIDINTAPLEDLVKIIHIGEKRAKELISLRPFSSLDDLIKIKGIGEKRVEDIKKQGLAWVSSQGKPEPDPKSEQKSEPKKETTPINYPGGVVFSEILPSPEGPDPENEWIEIFNQNNFGVDLSEWKIKDKEGKTTIYTFSAGTKISALGYLVFERPETKITLNNSGEGLELINPNGEIGDSVTLGKASLGQSYNKTQSGWSWSTTLTPGAKNIVPKSEPSFAKASEDREPALAKASVGKETAAIGEKLSKSSNFLFALLIAFAIAIFSAAVILILKKRISPKSPF